eukprot:Gregarina_sp_Poly_1__4637@NODE_247_length_10750_cov_169_692315_g217_i0_p10_GENE_NODE_247_length_10750_cov_169_692315_g217_i0NODE_247_length_10750_cov_169_692315_g217_i0_p10_ORF_typecomplete_len145_score19_04MFS_2/PF13347_6/0_00039DUF983/PF06170_12/3_3e02DUF983/PF06170_12/0_03MFS_1/PF07690_16/0_0088MFS_5/PF05631_14/0_011UNC93/PF05978_16/1_4_NODE_247_length_10750_cov_169_692315_g217_i060416475
MRCAKYNGWQLILVAIVLCISTTPFFQNSFPFEMMLRETGTFAHLCSQEQVDCELRQAAYAGLYVTTTTAAAFSAAIGGIILDQWGPKLSATLGFSIEIVGFLLLSLYNSHPSLLFLSLPLIAGGALFSFYGFIPIAELFPSEL